MPSLRDPAHPTPGSRGRVPSGERVILIDKKNRRIGQADKLAAHQAGHLHRAFSIFLVDADANTLLQKRANGKYHSAGLWSNSCCGHPRPGERTSSAALRRLREELGIEGVKLALAFRASYSAALDNGLVENEHVYVYFGTTADFRCDPNVAEVSAVRTASLPDLLSAVRRRPRSYSVWIRHYLEAHLPEITSAMERHSLVARGPITG
jgi:isopentenyl-diphosphate delta-isomerase